jgi:hypothetical protein
VASAFTLIPRDIWTIRSDDVVAGDSGAGGPEADELPALATADALSGAVVSGANASAQAGADLG